MLDVKEMCETRSDEGGYRRGTTCDRGTRPKRKAKITSQQCTRLRDTTVCHEQSETETHTAKGTRPCMEHTVGSKVHGRETRGVCHNRVRVLEKHTGWLHGPCVMYTRTRRRHGHGARPCVR